MAIGNNNSVANSLMSSANNCNFSTGNVQSFGGKYLELQPNTFIKYIDKFDDPNLPGEMVTSIWFKKVSVGTELKIIQEGIPSAIPVEAAI